MPKLGEEVAALPLSRQVGKQIGVVVGKQIGVVIGKQIGVVVGKQIGVVIGKQIGVVIVLATYTVRLTWAEPNI